MAAFENLLAPGSTELPDCRCGAEMHLFKVKPVATPKSVFSGAILAVMNFS
jgi:hypothetical protein